MVRKHVLMKSKIEYVSHCCNYVTGCAHDCGYCYARTLKRMTRAAWREPVVVPNTIELLRADIAHLKTEPAEIMVSSSHDAFQPDLPVLDMTWQVLEVLAEHSLPVWVLSKGGFRYWRYKDLLRRANSRYGVTITTHDVNVQQQWEGGAASTNSRIMSLLDAKIRGLNTWVSVEPPLPGLDLPRLVRQLNGIADFVVIGKLNYYPSNRDWVAFGHKAEELFAASGVSYHIKDDLRKLMMEGGNDDRE